MTRKLLNDVSASTLQVLLTQSLGLVVFLVTSFYLPKDIYGELNWSYAVCMFVITVLSLRLEQIVVKSAAIGKDTARIMTLFLIHVLLSGAGFYIFLLVLSFIFPIFFNVHGFLLVLAISQLLTYFSSPFKNVANGKERFGYLAIMSSIAVLVRAICLIIIVVFFQLNVQLVLMIFIVSSLIELAVCFYLVNVKMQIYLFNGIRFGDYFQLLQESLPQIGVAILVAGITRMDWIFLGLFSTPVVTAEYSFAYRVFELSPFPLLIIAPVLLSRLSRYFARHTEEQALLEEKKRLGLLIRWEMIVATLIPLVLNIIWIPLFDSLTGNKYGGVNQVTFLILSLCIPFLYINNFLWSAHFAQHRLKLILRITLVSFCIILVGDLLFIPFYKAQGAAFVYLAAMVIEYLNYMRSSVLSRIKETWQSLLICMISAAGSGLVAFYISDNVVWRLLIAVTLFSFLLLATKQFRVSDIKYIFYSKK